MAASSVLSARIADRVLFKTSWIYIINSISAPLKTIEIVNTQPMPHIVIMFPDIFNLENSRLKTQFQAWRELQSLCNEEWWLSLSFIDSFHKRRNSIKKGNRIMLKNIFKGCKKDTYLSNFTFCIRILPGQTKVQHVNGSTRRRCSTHGEIRWFHVSTIKYRWC